MLGIFLIVTGLVLLGVSMYFVIAYNNKKWPFSKKKSSGPGQMSAQEPDNMQPLPSWVGVIIIIFALVVVGAGIYVTVLRYQLAGKALSKGQGGVAVAALAPEIGSGIGNIFGKY